MNIVDKSLIPFCYFFCMCVWVFKHVCEREAREPPRMLFLHAVYLIFEKCLFPEVAD